MLNNDNCSDRAEAHQDPEPDNCPGSLRFFLMLAGDDIDLEEKVNDAKELNKRKLLILMHPVASISKGEDNMNDLQKYQKGDKSYPKFESLIFVKVVVRGKAIQFVNPHSIEAHKDNKNADLVHRDPNQAPLVNFRRR